MGLAVQKTMMIPILIRPIDVRRRSAGDRTLVVPIPERLRLSVVHPSIRISQ